MGDAFEWYDYRALNSRNALISIVGGPPSIGKTYGAKLAAVRDGIRTGRQTMWLRRSLTELNPAKEGFFDSLAAEWPGFDFRVNGNTGEVKADGDKWRPIIRFAALSVSYQMKGTEFPAVDRIVYDECFTPPGGRYLVDEVAKLRRLWITVNRDRVDRSGRAKTRVLLLGNPERLDNPWFLEWGFSAEREWQKGHGTGGDVILHLVDAERYVKRVTESIYGRAMGDAALEYADGAYFIPDGGYVVSERPGDSRPIASLVTMRGVFGLWESASYDALYVTVGELADERPRIAFEPLAVAPGVIHADARHPLARLARRYYRQGLARFVTPGAMAAQQALAR